MDEITSPCRDLKEIYVIEKVPWTRDGFQN